MSEIIPKHGGFRKLRSFQVAQQVYDGTVYLCHRFIDTRGNCCSIIKIICASAAWNKGAFIALLCTLCAFVVRIKHYVNNSVRTKIGVFCSF